MFYKKQGFPEEGEIVLCTIKKVLFHSVFVMLDEYNKEGMVHISEVSPGRIRNIRDYVKEGKKIVCKVLKVNKIKGHIDLSLRRVSQAQKINKNNEYKQEQKAEKILELAGKELKKDLNSMYKEAGFKIIEKYNILTPCFQEIVSNKIKLEDLGIPKKIATTITKIVKEKISIPKVTISGILNLQNNAPNGIELIKESLNKIKNKDIDIGYISAPKYKLMITSKDYKTAEEIIKNTIEILNKEVKKNNGIIEFKRND